MGFKPDNMPPSGFRPDTVSAPASSTAVSPIQDESGGMEEAFMRGGLKGATLGLDRPIISGAEAAGTYFNQPDINKRSFMDLMMESLAKTKAEEEELKRKHPFAYGGGEALSYAIPGAGSAQVFKNIGGKAAEKLASPVARSVAQGLAGVGTAEAAKKAMDITSTGQNAPSGLEFLTQLASTLPGTEAAGVMGPAGILVGKGITAAANKFTPELTGVSYDLLKKYATNPWVRKMIKENAGKETENAVNLAAHAENPPIPEYQQAVDLLRKSQDAGDLIPVPKTKQQLADILKTGPEAPSQEAGIKELQKWQDKYIGPKERTQQFSMVAKPPAILRDIAPGDPAPFPAAAKKREALLKQLKENPDLTYTESGIPPLVANKLKQLLREKIPYGERGAEFIDQKLKGLASTLKSEIEAKMGPDFKQVMEQTAGKMGALEGVTDNLGKKMVNWDSRAEKLIKDAYKVPAKMEILQKYDNQFGTDFANEAKAMGMAREIGGTGPALFPKQTTGRSTLGGLMSLLAGGAGYGVSHNPIGMLAAVPPLVAQSPAAVAGGIRAANALSPAVGRGLEGLGAKVTEAELRKRSLKNKLNQ